MIISDNFTVFINYCSNTGFIQIRDKYRFLLEMRQLDFKLMLSEICSYCHDIYYAVRYLMACYRGFSKAYVLTKHTNVQYVNV